MANSKLLKEAIADAKAVKETALANAKLALEEAFTPRLQSILSQKMRAEAEMEDDEAKKVDEELDSTGIGSKVEAGYAETPGATPTLDADTDLSVGVKKDSGKPEAAGTDYTKVADINEEEENPFADQESDKDAEIAELKARLAELEGEDSEEENPFAKTEGDDEMGMDDMDMDSEMGDDSMDMDSDDEESEDDMDLEAIIRELEAQLGDDESEKEEDSMYEAEEEDDEKEAKNEAEEEDDEKEAKNEAEEDDKKDDVIDLEEILREMEDDMKGDAEDKKADEKDAELNEAYKTIKSLQKTINEVNLLNAKLLFANKLFRAHNMTNEQKVKVIETLDRTNSVREVKLVYSTLAENFKYTSTTQKSTKKSISEGIASKTVKSTKPAQAKAVIAESADFSNRFKKLAGIIK